MIEKIAYLDQPNCYRLCRAGCELVVTTDIGPRILRYAFEGGENILGEYPALVTPTPWGDWKPWGGHRLWVAPEEMPLSYAPDNGPVQFEKIGEEEVRLTQPEDRAGFEKQMTVALTATGVVIHHRIINRRNSSARIAPWAITIMRPAGMSLIPQEPFRSHNDCLLPARSLVLWYFTDLTDPRLLLGRKFLRLRAERALLSPQKIGAANQQGWSAFYDSINSTLFVKRVEYLSDVTYPDFGANTESYVAGDYLELETLGALADLEPGAAATHIEQWQLFRDVHLAESEDEIELTIKALLG